MRERRSWTLVPAAYPRQTIPLFSRLNDTFRLASGTLAVRARWADVRTKLGFNTRFLDRLPPPEKFRNLAGHDQNWVERLYSIN
jgi:hypothetical protein